MTNPRFVLYLAVLPSYRQACIEVLREEFGKDLGIWVSEAHLDDSVRTDLPHDWYQPIHMWRFGRYAFAQGGPWLPAINAEAVVLDLNPRSMTAWGLLLLRKILGRRTLLWGHLNRQHRQGQIGPLRTVMLRLSSGFVAYTYTQGEQARSSGHFQVPVWVAPNAVYRADEIEDRAERSRADSCSRSDFLYVGRLVPQKKVDLALRAFADFVERGNPEARLRIAGTGPEQERLAALAEELAISEKLVWLGWCEGEALVSAYTHAVATLCPGFAGLGLTQSLGYGIPQLIADAEPHSPEIELAADPWVRWFSSDDAAAMADAMELAWQSRQTLPDLEMSQRIVASYSAEAMAGGIADALRDHQS